MGDKCPYGYVFETSPPEDAREFAKNREVPRPYVFEPPEETRMEYEPGERMRFGFTVIGRAAEYMPCFIYASSKMGEEGIGRLRTRYALEQVIAEIPLSGTRDEIFDGEIVKNRRLPTSWEYAASAARSMDGTRVRLEFVTPTFIRFKGEVSPETPSFAAVVQNLLIGIPMLSAIHCREVWQEDFKALVARAGEVETVTDETTWVSFRRYSSFRQRSETLEGVVGRVEYAGPVEEFLPLLHVGQLTHAGKRAVFGLGRYRLRES